jgi:hypothetical protein
LKLYGFSANLIFDRSLHFIAAMRVLSWDRWCKLWNFLTLPPGLTSQSKVLARLVYLIQPSYLAASSWVSLFAVVAGVPATPKVAAATEGGSPACRR